jgi:hypothetical protein
MASDSPASFEESSDYNRIKLSSDRKNEICSQIADSSESLPMWNTNDRDPTSSSIIPDSSDLATPMPKTNNPLDSAGAAVAAAAATTTNGGDGKNGSGGHLLSQVPTQTETEGNGSVGPKKGDRPGTLRRLTTRIKRSISSNRD